MTREEAIKILESMSDISTQGEAIDVAIEALSEDGISDGGTLKVNVSDASKVKRVMVWGEESGGLYYPDRPTGEWIEAELDKGFRVCSVCKNKGYKDKMAWRTDFIKSYLNFCPNCGARMKGGAE